MMMAQSFVFKLLKAWKTQYIKN